jgi:hypothetical protein
VERSTQDRGGTTIARAPARPRAESSAERGGTTIARRPARTSREEAARAPRQDRAEGRSHERGGTTLVRRPTPAPGERRAAPPPPAPPPTPVRAAPPVRPQAASSAPSGPRRNGEFDLSAWARELAPRVDAPAPAPAPPPSRARRETFDLSAWVQGLTRPLEETPAEPFRTGLIKRTPPPPKRKAITMNDLFDGPAVPPCLQDDD